VQFLAFVASILALALRGEAMDTFPSRTTSSKELDPGILMSLFGSLNRGLPYVYNWIGLVMAPLVFIVSRICRMDDLCPESYFYTLYVAYSVAITLPTIL
jgi:hypothetical protein